MIGMLQRRGHTCLTKKSVRVSECFLQSRKKCIPGMERGKVLLPMIEKP
jgi:hypothetical protein